MSIEVIVTICLALTGGCLTLSVNYPRVCIDVFETLSRALMQILMAALFVFLGHAATRLLVAHNFANVFDGRVYSDAPGEESSKILAEHAEFALSRMQSAITSTNDLFLQWLSIGTAMIAANLLLFSSCTFLAKKITEHGYDKKASGSNSNPRNEDNQPDEGEKLV